jgi:hypothetical protein
VAGATWFAAGRALWLLPNMLSEVRFLGSPGTCACILQPLRCTIEKRRAMSLSIRCSDLMA